MQEQGATEGMPHERKRPKKSDAAQHCAAFARLVSGFEKPFTTIEEKQLYMTFRDQHHTTYRFDATLLMHTPKPQP